MRKRWLAVVPVTALGLLVGCGGSGGSTGGGATIPSPTVREQEGTARVDVNVETGKITFTPLTAPAAERGRAAVLGGRAVTFETVTTLLEGGEVGRRAVRVRLRNNLQESIGIDRPIRLFFGQIFNNPDSGLDIRPTTNVSTVVRGVVGNVDGAIGTAQFGAPLGTAVGPDGAIYMAGDDGRVRRIAESFVSTVAQNSPVAGIAYLRDPATGREFLVGASPTLHSLKLIPIGSGSVTTWAGLDNTPGNTNGAAGSARFNAPVGVAVDPLTRQILVADSGNNTVRAVPYSFVGGNLVAGNVLNRYSGLTAPRYVAVSENGSVGVVETSAHRIRIFNLGSSREAFFGGTVGDQIGNGNVARFNQPSGLTTLGNVFFVADTQNRQIKRIALKDGAAPLLSANWTVSRVAGDGTSGNTDGTGIQARFINPLDITTDPNGRLVLVDSVDNSVRRITSENRFEIGVPGGIPAEVSLVNYTDLARVGTENLKVIDVPTTLAPGESAEIGDWQFAIPEGVTSFQFNVTVETGTSVFAPLEAVSNPSGPGPGSPNVRIFRINGPSLGEFLGPISQVGGGRSYDVDRAGNIYIVDRESHTIRRVGTDGQVTLVAGRFNVAGSDNGLGSVALFFLPDKIRVSPAGDELFVLDNGNLVVRRIGLRAGFNPALSTSWSVSTIVGAVGTPGDTNGLGSAARVRSMSGIAFAPSGNSVYIAESSESQANRIRLLRWNGGDRAVADNWRVSTLAGQAAAGYVDASATLARFNRPRDLAVGPDGLIYVADQGNHRVRVITPTDGQIVSTFAGDGTEEMRDGPRFSSGLPNPIAVEIDRSGAVYVSTFVNQSTAVRRIWNGQTRTVLGGENSQGTTGADFRISTDAIRALSSGDVIVGQDRVLYRLTRLLGR